MPKHKAKPQQSRRFTLNIADGKIIAIHAAFVFACAAPWIAIGLICGGDCIKQYAG